MANATRTSFAYALKKIYKHHKMDKTFYEDSPGLAMIKKETDFQGLNFSYGLIYAPSAARSNLFATAKANKSSHAGSQFVVTIASDYAVGALDNLLIMTSKHDQGALVRAATAELNSSMYMLKKQAGIDFFGTGSGKLGGVGGSVGADPTLTLENASEVSNFEVGQKLVFAATEASALGSATTLTVSAIDTSAGTMEMSANLNTIAGLAVGDDIFAEGDYVSASDRKKIMGLSGWIPATAPAVGGGDSHFGVDRAAHPTRMAGHRISGVGLSVSAALTKACFQIQPEGGRPDCAIMSFTKMRELINELGAKVNYESHNLGEVGFSAVKILTPKGELACYADQYCPNGTIWVLRKDSWALKTVGGFPQIISSYNGDTFRTEDDTDSVEFRLAYHGNLYCLAPGWNGRIDF